MFFSLFPSTNAFHYGNCPRACDPNCPKPPTSLHSSVKLSLESSSWDLTDTSLDDADCVSHPKPPRYLLQISHVPHLYLLGKFQILFLHMGGLASVSFLTSPNPPFVLLFII